MPYIKLEDRPKFEFFIKEVLNILHDPSDNIYVKGEYFGFFVNRLVKRWLADPEADQNSFNSFYFSEAKRKSLSNAADNVAAAINRGDPIATAGELNYAISAPLWGFLGLAEGFASASYGMRTYLRGILEKVLATVETVNRGSQRDMTMAFRRHLIVRGVLADVVSETYRRLTSPYEDEKLLPRSEDGQSYMNNDVWKDGKLNHQKEWLPLKGETKGAVE